MNPATRSVIFDYDGTLVDTAGAFLESVNRALGNAGLRSATRREISSMDLRSIIGDRAREVEYPGSVHDVFDSIWEAFADTLSSPFHLREGADETLNELAKQRIGLALISKRGGRAGSLPLVELRATGLDTLFRFVAVGVSSDEYGAVLSKALQAVMVGAEETVVVSDWCKDVECAKHSGFRTMGIVGGVSDEDEFRDAGATWIIKNLGEIPRILALG